MSIAIDPLIRHKLDQFVSRRRRWTLLHAVCVALVVWLVGLLLFTWIDAVWILERGTRSLLSIVVYLAAIASGIALFVRKIGKDDPLRRAAIEIERERPDLRDHLLSAVELASVKSHKVSQSFVGAAQRTVAGRIRTLDVRMLLPVTQLSRPLSVVAAVVAGCLILSFMPQLQYAKRFARAIIPGFDIDRVSRTKIVIERPSPASGSVPASEITAIVARLEGAISKTATLQWRDDDGAGGKIAMMETNSLSSNEDVVLRATFAANLPVAEAGLSYRIQAGDGVTKWQRLEPRYRPEVTQFETQMTPPRYTQLPTEPQSKSDGNLAALMGTTVSLRATFNMPVIKAVMRRLNSDQRIPMTLQGKQWVIDTVIDFDDRYQILATAAETGFDNPLSPQYTITPIPDDPPLAKWKDEVSSMPVGASRSKVKRELVTSFSKMNLAAMFSDEMPVQQIDQEVSINGDAWQASRLEGDLESSQVRREWIWDLKPLRYKGRELIAGDVIQTRVVAVDRKGQRGESIIKEFIVSDQTLDASRRERLSAWITLANNVGQWRMLIQSEAVRLNIQDKPAQDKDKEPNVAPGINDEEAIKSREQLFLAMIDEAATDSEAGKLELAARAIRRTEIALANAEKTDVKKRRELRWIASNADAIHESIKTEVAHQLAMVMMDDMYRVSSSIQPIVRQTDPIEWTSFSRYFEVTREQLQELAAAIENAASVVPDSTRQHNLNLLRWIDDQQRRLEDAIKQDNNESVVRQVGLYSVSELSNRRYQGLIDGRIQSLQIETLKRLQSAVGWTKEPLAELVKFAEASEKARAKTVSGSSDEVRAAKESLASINEEKKRLTADLITRLKSDGALHRGRPEADQRYVADTHLLERVLLQISDETNQLPEGKTLAEVNKAITDAYHWLESGHEVLQWGSELRTLADDDRWNANTAEGRVDAPNRIERFTQGLEFATNGLQQTGMPWAEVEPIANLRWNGLVNDIAASITSRRWKNESAVSAADKLDAHHTEFLRATESLAQPMQSARKTLESFLPSIAELARKTASTLKESKPKEPKQDDPSQQREQEAKKRDEAMTKAEQLKETLVDEANAQDLMTEDGRRKARNADISLSAIEQRMEDLQAAAAKAESASSDQQAEASKQLGEQTDKAVSALEQIAKHYEQEYPEDESATAPDPSGDSPLKQLEDELDLKSELDRDFAKSEALAKALQSDPMDLLKKLQQELKRNPLMQKELDDITNLTLKEAQLALQEQAARERDLQLQIERSDPKLVAQKRAMEQSIRRAGEVAQEIERSLMSAANQSVQSLRDLPELSKQRAQTANQEFQNATGAIRDAVNQASQTGSADSQLMADLVERSEDVAETLSQAVESLRTTSQPLDQILQDETAALEAKRRSDERRNMENVQRRARDNQVQIAREQQRRLSQNQQRQEQEVRSAKQRLEREENNLRKVEERKQKEPDNQSLNSELQRLRNEVKNADAVVAAAQQTVDQSKKASDAAKKRADEISKTQIVPLDQGQPAAQLAQLMQQRASDVLEEARRSLEAASAESEANQVASPRSNVINAASDVQEKISNDVLEIAEDMARAARHQQRLGETQVAQATAEGAEAVKKIAEEEVNDANESLANAKSAMSDSSGNETPGHEETAAAQAAVAKAQAALADQAMKLGEANESLGDATKAAEQQEGSSGESESARQKAQTLDELDRSISAARRAAQASQDPGQAGEPSDEQSESDSPATLAAAARKQAQQMAKKRSQSQQGMPQSPSQGEGEPSSDATMSGDGASTAMADFFDLDEIDRVSDEDWGKLREMEAEDVAEQRRVEISPAYRKQIEAYFRAIAEQAKQ